MKHLFDILILVIGVNGQARLDTPGFCNQTAIETSDPTFKSKTYHVETADGAILTAFRMKPENLDSSKRPVLMQHGLGSSSDIFLLTQKKSLAYGLFKKGYDVWLGNFRSNDYCQNSTVYTDIRTSGFGNQNEFWNHTFYELAIYDLPALMELVLEETGADKLHYIGHSMGTLTMFLAMDYYGAPDLREDSVTSDIVDNFQDKIIDMHALGPVWNLKHNDKNPIVGLAKSSFSYFMIRQYIGRYMLYRLPFGVKPDTSNNKLMIKNLLGDDAFADLFTLHAKTYDQAYLQEILGHVPQTASWKTMYHFLELSKYGKLSTFPYTEKKKCTGGFFAQKCEYTQISRIFDLSGIRGKKIHLYSGESDTLSVPAEADDIQAALQAKNQVTKNVFKKMDHMGLLADKRAPRLVYKKIMKRMMANK